MPGDLSLILQKDPSVCDEYNRLFKESESARGALQQFCQRVAKDIDSYTDAVLYIKSVTLTDLRGVSALRKLIAEQKELITRWEAVHTHKGDAIINDLMAELEIFSKNAHQVFASLYIPLFCVETRHYPGISSDRRRLILFIQSSLK